MHATLRFVLTIGMSLSIAAPAWSQARLAYITHLEGAVRMHHRYVPNPARVGDVVIAGDHVQTTVGRAELTFPDGSVLHLDHYTRVAFNLASQFELIDGRVFMRTSGVSSGAGWVAQTAAGRVRMFPRGIYGMMTTERSKDAHLRVVVGYARFESRWGTEEVTARHTAFLSGPTGRPFVSVYAPPRSDPFENWSASRSMLATLGPTSPWPVEESERAPGADEYRESRHDETYIDSSSTRYPYPYGRWYYGRAGRPPARQHQQDDEHAPVDRARGRRSGERSREEAMPPPAAVPPPVKAPPVPAPPPPAGGPSAGVRVPKR